jgi:hypothetical protein
VFAITEKDERYIRNNEIATLAFGKFAMTEGWIPVFTGMTKWNDGIAASLCSSQ